MYSKGKERGKGNGEKNQMPKRQGRIVESRYMSTSSLKKENIAPKDNGLPIKKNNITQGHLPCEKPVTKGFSKARGLTAPLKNEIKIIQGGTVGHTDLTLTEVGSLCEQEELKLKVLQWKYYNAKMKRNQEYKEKEMELNTGGAYELIGPDGTIYIRPNIKRTKGGTVGHTDLTLTEVGSLCEQEELKLKVLQWKYYNAKMKRNQEYKEKEMEVKFNENTWKECLEVICERFKQFGQTIHETVWKMPVENLTLSDPSSIEHLKTLLFEILHVDPCNESRLLRAVLKLRQIYESLKDALSLHKETLEACKGIVDSMNEKVYHEASIRIEKCLEKELNVISINM
ncbi:hypothetical protein O9G_002029 [Rozella allomycis CSF55]|uniref:Uncharacterized protein n=1 Tax=Rozella allomycis (strain CSF55) TaxID=988480 RepID=A0A075B247_ROZAC|nr:hypothetical protein O9G_002029 [Rozella allomycis CSF55]|eukprot:EPZ34898.1 hypothetical protein O9G_002029 [Rozella allomycis CSF55]